MRRREFMGACAGAALTAAARRSPVAALPVPAPAEPDGVPFSLTVMLWTVFRDLPFPQRLEKVAEAGYHAVELVGEFSDWKPQDFADARRKKRVPLRVQLHPEPRRQERRGHAQEDEPGPDPPLLGEERHERPEGQAQQRGDEEDHGSRIVRHGEKREG